MDYCRQITVDDLSCNTKFQSLHTWLTLYCNTKFQVYLNTQHSKCIVLQYNFQQYTFILLQYNSMYCNTIFQPLSPPIAIHFLSQKDYIAIQSVNHQAPLLQYNSHPISLLLQYKTKPTTLPRLQYNFPIAIQSQPNYILLLQYNCNTIFFSSPLSCNTIARLQYKTKKFHKTIGQ